VARRHVYDGAAQLPAGRQPSLESWRRIRVTASGTSCPNRWQSDARPATRSGISARSRSSSGARTASRLWVPETVHTALDLLLRR
jgi:hypothetical protein